jgi:hypothetical protein
MLDAKLRNKLRSKQWIESNKVRQLDEKGMFTAVLTPEHSFFAYLNTIWAEVGVDVFQVALDSTDEVLWSSLFSLAATTPC